MAVNFYVVRQNYDVTGKGELRYFGRVKASGETSFNKICGNLSYRSTVTKGDLLASLEGFIYAMTSELEFGRIVRLGDFGHFQLGMSSKGTLNRKDFNKSKIKGARIIFRPSKELQEMLSNIEFHEVPGPRNSPPAKKPAKDNP